MSLQPFTPAGVSAKTAELYALSNTLLFAQADAVEADFSTWMKDNFSLTTAESTFLTGINAHAATYYGAQCSMAFRARLSVSLVTPDPIGSNKWVKSESTLAVSTDASGALQTTGSLTFKVEYL